ncbi:MAG: SHOCT domain-containing protein [Ruminococcaceae bacterium]|nr:SHOCT domain-containing protein [Oscillospiraceae bacterium]
MAEFCKLCSAKLGFFGIYCVQIKGRDINLCEKCNNDFKLVRDSVTDEESFNKNLAAFRAKHNNSKEFQFFDSYFKGVYESDKAVKIRANNKKLPLTEDQLIGPFTDREYIYTIAGTKDKHIVIFNDRVVITSNPSFLKTLVYDVIDSEKVIYFSDCIGLQYRINGIIGYFQFETAATQGYSFSRTYIDENTFSFIPGNYSIEKIKEIVDFIQKKIGETKAAKHNIAPPPVFSVADELLKLKQLLDMGVLTQEEFDTQKKKLLG